MEENIREALSEAVKRLYFDDGADYEAALWRIVKLLGVDEAVDLLETDEAAAYEKYCR